MQYTVQKLARMAGISPRTLRYYDEIGILKPARISSSGYRIYGRDEVDRLQQILFYRELGVSLETSKGSSATPLLTAPRPYGNTGRSCWPKGNNWIFSSPMWKKPLP